MTREEKAKLKSLIEKITEQKEEFQQVAVRGRTIMSRNVARGQYDVLTTVIAQLKQFIPQEYEKEKEKVFKIPSVVGKRVINTPINIIYNYSTEEYKVVAFPNSEKEITIFESNAIIGAWSYHPTLQTTCFKGGTQLISKRAFEKLEKRYPETTARAIEIQRALKEMGKWIAQNIAYRGKVVGK